MKKFSFMALALGLFLAAANAMAAGAPSGLQDSTWLANDNVMSKTVGQPNSGSALGSVIVWTNAGMPADAVNWRECNGQSLAGTDVCKKLKICTAPDYRGMFLRGLGGKSSALGTKQQDSVYLRKEDGTKLVFNGLAWGNTYYTSYNIAGDDSFSVSSIDFKKAGYSEWNWDFKYVPEVLLGKVQSSGEGAEVDVAIKSTAKETRPENIAVRYLIKVN